MPKVAAAKIAAASLAILLGVGAVAYADDDMPGPGWITMDQALQHLHSSGYKEIIKLKADDGFWKAKASKDGAIYKVRLDPHTGDVVASAPDHEKD